MTKEEAIKILEEGKQDEYTRYQFETCLWTAVDMAIEALQAQATLDDVSTAYENGYQQGKFEAQQWIPCSERLPDTDFTDYLVQIGHGKYAVYETAYRVRGRWVFYSDRIDGEGQSVIAWIECPSPYKENES